MDLLIPAILIVSPSSILTTTTYPRTYRITRDINHKVLVLKSLECRRVTYTAQGAVELRTSVDINFIHRSPRTIAIYRLPATVLDKLPTGDILYLIDIRVVVERDERIHSVCG